MSVINNRRFRYVFMKSVSDMSFDTSLNGMTSLANVGFGIGAWNLIHALR
jgi:hypothetical protein